MGLKLKTDSGIGSAASVRPLRFSCFNARKLCQIGVNQRGRTIAVQGCFVKHMAGCSARFRAT